MKALAEQIGDIDGVNIYGRVVGVRGLMEAYRLAGQTANFEENPFEQRLRDAVRRIGEDRRRAHYRRLLRMIERNLDDFDLEVRGVRVPGVAVQVHGRAVVDDPAVDRPAPGPSRQRPRTPSASRIPCG